MNSSFLALATITLVAACGGGSDPARLTDKGYEALRSGDFSSAEKTFDQALAELGSNVDQPGWLRAKMGAVESRTHTDAARARSEFLELAAAHPSKLTDKDYNLIAVSFVESKKLEDAIAVLAVGMQAHPESPHLAALTKKLGDMAKSTGSSEALDALKGLGYVGD